MPLNSSGPISLAGSTAGQSIALELGLSATGQISLNDSNVRTLAGVASGAIVMPTDFYGKANTYSASYLVVGGGGGGGAFNAGVRWGTGGNGGSAPNGSLTLTPGTTYTVTVGGGGAGGTGRGGAAGSTGSNSVFGSVTGNGGAGNASGTTTGGGGFGNGTTNSSGTGGWGGIGLSSSITGSSVKYAGGGTYGNPNGADQPADYGVLYGGGYTNEFGPQSNPVANTGGGGGGGQNGNDGGSRTNNGQTGATGVVIISVPTSRYSGTTTGSPTVTTSGSNTILRYTGSGSYTA